MRIKPPSLAQAATPTLPLTGQPWPGQGGAFAGLRITPDGKQLYALILAVEAPEKLLAWKPAQAWAKKLKVEGHKDFVVPDRAESLHLFETVRDLVGTSGWYWTSTQYSGAGYAWCQYFVNGGQIYGVKSDEGRVRAVRRLPIDPSILLGAAQ